jgi:hypothetical protein
MFAVGWVSDAVDGRVPYISDKDLFAEFYRKRLARRLLQVRFVLMLIMPVNTKPSARRALDAGFTSVAAAAYCAAYCAAVERLAVMFCQPFSRVLFLPAGQVVF